MPETRPSALGPGLWLALLLVLSKASHWSWPGLEARAIRDYVKDVLVSAHADVAFALAFALGFEIVLLALQRRERLRAAAYALFLALGALCSVYAVASIQIFAFLRSPLTYPLLYLAGDMRSMRSSIGSFVTPAIGVALVLAPLAFLLGALRLRTWRPRARGGGLLLLAIAGWLLFGHLFQATGRWRDRDDHLIARSPHYEFLASCARELVFGGGQTWDEPFSQEDLADFAPPPPRALPLPRDLRVGNPPTNVLVIVLESTGAKYLSLFGSRYDTTPRLAAEAGHALVFDRFYCHVGLTANSLAALSLSIFPYMTWREYTVEYPDFPGATLADVLKARGYRTAFLHSGDLEYLGQDRFLANRGFDALIDLDQLGPEQRLSSWGGDDRMLVDGVLRFIDADRSRPFYAMAWTIESHHPYEPPPHHPMLDFFGAGSLPPDDYDLGRYLNTLRSVDRELGRLFDGLRERGLDDETLVVVLGDHGEAFGDPHPTSGHGTRLYEENVRVPLVLWSPRLFPEGRREQAIGGHVDVNPTVAHLLGVPPAPSWRGRSLFDPDRPPRTYFYAANDDYLLGLREGDWKYVRNVTRGRDELYDLRSDPDELRNVAAEQQERCRRWRGRLAAWRDAVGRELRAVRPE